MTTTSDDPATDRLYDQYDSGSDWMSRDRYGMYGGRSVDTDDQGPGPRLMGADTLLGNDVYNSRDEDLGDIKEIMLDMQSGKVAYAVLSFGGFLGMGNKLFAVPWNALKLDTANHRFLLDVDKDRLRDAPGFDPDHWPDMADQTWASNVHSFYGSRYDAEAGSGSIEDRFSAAGSGPTSYESGGEGSFGGTSSIAGSGSNAQPNDRVPTNTTGATPGSFTVA